MAMVTQHGDDDGDKVDDDPNECNDHGKQAGTHDVDNDGDD